MLSIALFFALLGVSSAKNVFPNEVVVTSGDVTNNEIKDFGTAGETYRLYAICATAQYYTVNETLLEQVTITDSAGKSYSLNDFHKKEANGGFLSDDRIVTGPITVHDALLHLQATPTRLDYTIYIVSTKVPALPVVDPVMYLYNDFDSNRYNGKDVRGVTFLSADGFFTLRNFYVTADSHIIPRGYDMSASGAADSVLDLAPSNAYLAHVTIFGPIATIATNDPSKTGRFQATYDYLNFLNGGKDLGAQLSLLSPNYLSLDDSYSAPWINSWPAFDRQYTFPTDTILDFTMSAAALKTGESLNVEIKCSDGVTRTWSYGPSDKGVTSATVWGHTFKLKANVNEPSNPSTSPRFIVRVTSDASMTSALVSLLLILLCLFQ